MTQTIVETSGNGVGEAAAVELPAKTKAKKKKRKKMKYSAGLGLLQMYFRAVNKAGVTLGRAASAYWDEWDQSWDRSAKKKRNGGLVDIPANYGRALSRTFEVGSRGPRRFTRALPRIKKLTLLRALFPPLWFVR